VNRTREGTDCNESVEHHQMNVGRTCAGCDGECSRPVHSAPPPDLRYTVVVIPYRPGAPPGTVNLPWLPAAFSPATFGFARIGVSVQRVALPRDLLLLLLLLPLSSTLTANRDNDKLSRHTLRQDCMRLHSLVLIAASGFGPSRASKEFRQRHPDDHARILYSYMPRKPLAFK